MARSRNIKPGFFLNDKLAECDPLARLLFAGLWCIADREGRLEDRPKRIKAEILPYDDCDVDKLLNQLAKQGFIIRYEIDDKRYIQISNFLKHQNPHIKEAASTIPPPPEVEPAPDEHHTSTVLAPEKHSSFPADSLNLIPDSLNLIPDSLNLIPDSLKHDPEILYSPNPPASDEPLEPEKTIKLDAEIILDHWNSKDIIRHRKLTDKIKRAINGALRSYSADEICAAIDNYTAILTDDKYYWSYRWTLQDFLQRGIEKFLDFKTAAQNYLKDKPKTRDAPTMSRNVENALRLVEKYALEESGYP